MTSIILGRRSILRLDRQWFTSLSTIGELYLPEKSDRLAYTLEDTVRAPGERKVQDETAIPEGTYEMVMSFSNKFRQMMPLLLGVAGFTGIRFHKGNRAKDSRGCILVADKYEPLEHPNWISNSVIGYDRFRAAVDPLFQIGKVFCTVRNVRGPSPQSDIASA